MSTEPNLAISASEAQLRAERRSLILIFACAMALTIASAVVVFNVGRRVIVAQDRMADQLMVLKEAPEFISVMTDAETGQRGYVLTGEDSYLAPYNDAVRKVNAQVQAIKEMANKGLISKESVHSISDSVQAKLDELKQTVDLRREKGFEASEAVVRTNRGKEHMDSIRRRIDEVRATAQQAYDVAEAISIRATWVRTFTFIAATILNVAFLAWTFRRIAQQDWLRAGQMRLSVAMSGEKNLAQLGDEALKLLAEYLQAQAGAIFVEENGRYERAATYAVPAGADVPEEFAAGEGLLGQAVKDVRPFVVKNVPEGYLATGSGLGTARVRSLLIAPMKVGGTVNAALELGFFGAAPRLGPELMTRVSEAVSMAVRSAKYRTKLQELMEETQRQSEELQSQGEELRVSNEELTEQSRALKESQSRLEQQQVEMEQTNSQLEEQTQLLETQRDDLRRAKVDLEYQAKVVEQASRYKSDFLANMSHELRTPLNSSLILAKLLADNKAGNLTAEQVKFAQTIQSAGNDLLALINDVLDLSKIEAGHFELRPQTMPVGGLVENLRSMFAPIATQRQLALKMTIAPGTPQNIYTDAQRLEQVLKNLLSNALKFTEKGEVVLEVSRSGEGRVAFAVRDTGIGIADSQQKAIFEPFVQADGTTNRKYGGTGLGLSISRELVRLLGGTIRLASNLGTGSVFTIDVPESYVKEDVAPRAEKPLDAEIVPEDLSSAAAKPATEAAQALKRGRIPDDREKLNGKQRIILIVEDDEIFAAILSDIAHESNFQSLIASSAEEALALAQQYSPSAVLLDVGLPDNSGMYVLERMKADARTRHIPVHIVSGSDHTETAMAMGAVGYMLKPVQREQLAEAFEKLEARLTQKMRRVLVVEDDAVQLDSLQKLLASNDVKTTGVQTAADCLEELKNKTFDCMVMDLTLPDASGFSLLKTLSEQDAYSFPPVIIYTGRDLLPDEEQQLRKYSKSIIIKGAKSPERLLDEVTLFLHQVVSDLPPEQQKMLEKVRGRDAALEGRRVLIVEDDIRNIFALTSLLETHGVMLDVARNGKEALTALEKAAEKKAPAPDLVLMDIMMPEMDGMTAMREIRKLPQWKKLPIIALTAKAMKNDHKDCLDAGANDYLAKPLDVEKLLSLVRVWMPR
jgi:signal transduction histidine kinase/CheY-like chemotaxis protein/CHASE3 domain sensor protein